MKSTFNFILLALLGLCNMSSIAMAVSKDQALTELDAYFSEARRNSTKEAKVIFQIFTLGKYDIEAMRGDKRFTDHSQKVFGSSVWRNQKNQLFEVFVMGWGLYSFRTSSNDLSLLFSTLDVNDPRLKAVIYDYNFQSPGRDFQDQPGRRNWLLSAGAELLLTEPYRGTAAGVKLLDHMYKVWQQMKSGSQFSPYPRDLWVNEIMKLLSVEEYKENEKVREMVREIPTLLANGTVGLSGLFSDKRVTQTYRSALKNNRELFKGAIVKSAMDDLIEFYQNQTEKQQNARPDEELRVLTRAFEQSKYDFEALMRDPEFSGILKKIAARPIWGNESNGLVKLYIESWGFYSLKFSSEITANILSHLDPNSRYLRQVIQYADFGRSPGNDFIDREKRVDYLRPILTELLLTKPYKNTDAGNKLIQNIYSQWKDFKRTSPYIGYGLTRWITGLWSTIAVEGLRSNPLMAEIYRDIYLMAESGKKITSTEGERKEYNRLAKKYKGYLESAPAKPSFTAAAPVFPVFENPMTIWCRVISGK